MTKNRRKNLVYKTDMTYALQKLDKAISKLGATELMQGGSIEPGGYVHRITFKYHGETYKFIYSRQKAEAQGYYVQKDQYIAIANINAVNDLAKLSDRGIYDFGTMIQGFKAIEYIELPWFIQYMGFQTAPRNQQELRDKYRKLSLTSMNPEHYPEEFKKLQDAYELSKNWVG